MLTFRQKFVNFLKLLFPSTFIELGIFVFFLLVYGILGSYIALNFRIIFDSRIPWDAYFSFDNKAIIMTGGSFERHPLSYYFFNWMRDTVLLFTDGKTDVNFRLILAWLSNLTISLSLVQIYKYLNNIIRLPLLLSLLIVFFFSLFSTNILLSFTPETYTYTLFLLVLFNYYTAIKFNKNGKIAGSALVLAGVTIGGLTVTNIVKIFIPIIFENGLFKSWKKFGNAAFRVILACAVFVLLYLNRIDFKYQNILSKSGEQYEKFSNVKSTPIWDMIYSYFFGGNILFPSFFIREKHNMEGFYFKAIFMETYSTAFAYIFIGLVLGLVLWSYCKNFKNKLVQILMISFLVDITIHCIFRFGLHTSYIYGGHFIFIYPLLLGWLFFAYSNSPKTLSFLTMTTVVLTIYLLLNNYHRMIDFFEFLNTYYQ
ncbi:hypothetical protein CHRY9390_01303 [Chryseobacterium aquaeductus]|uniref:Uncharacterized protein n=1 Tax=Chryseobacterium aquaeductus TaxID=2675056 RepID=A0A9N8MGC4_9FLAO|nr:DUF6080 domain-containing protein [Chryseobacterium aquaeductus]CAA7330632.1 hypothetical protein CHRY9390_01303 [Chryseobacterium potabilaquae]CAD7804993.1 hypothetical protein CHRY9390_01303 [Chryseobacterium aquaeductus]